MFFLLFSLLLSSIFVVFQNFFCFSLVLFKTFFCFFFSPLLFLNWRQVKTSRWFFKFIALVIFKKMMEYVLLEVWKGVVSYVVVGIVNWYTFGEQFGSINVYSILRLVIPLFYHSYKNTDMCKKVLLVTLMVINTTVYQLTEDYFV